MPDTRKEATDALARAMSDALTTGLTTDDIGEIAEMVAAQQPLALEYPAERVAKPATSRTPPEPTIGTDYLPIYTELPEGLIDLPTAAKEFGCSVHRIRGWVRRGHIPIKGRLKAGAPGGGYFVVSKADLEHRLATASTKGGRPRKKR